jgi:hypothetical protein
MQALLPGEPFPPWAICFPSISISPAKEFEGKEKRKRERKRKMKQEEWDERDIGGLLGAGG